MMRTNRPAAMLLRLSMSCVWAVLTTSPVLVHAQHRGSALRDRESLAFAERVAVSATLEIALFGVPGVSDLQRDSIQVLEQQLRDTIAFHGEAIRRARQMVRTGWPSEPELFERGLNAIEFARQAAFTRLRATMTAAQGERLDHNLLAVRDVDLWHWYLYAKPFRGPASIDIATTP